MFSNHNIFKKTIISLCILLLCSCNTKNNIEEKVEDNSLITFEYSFNPHVISQEYITIYGNQIEEDFYRFCDTILANEDRFECQSREYFFILLSIADSCFPIALDLIDKDKIYFENNICHISYNYDSKQCKERIDNFINKVTNVITNSIKYEEDDYIKAMELYTYVANKNTVDESYTLEDSLKLKTYRSIMENIGICQELAKEYIYYLLQIGINATTCSALNSDQSEAHEWVLIKLNDNYYHVDPTYAIQYPNSLYFFCLDDIQREYYGDYPIGTYAYASSAVLKYEDFKASDRKYEKFWLAQEYEIDHQNKIIHTKDINTNNEHDYKLDE